MQATIYVTEEAFIVANEIKEMAYYDRMLYLDKVIDLPQREGYYLMNANYLKIAILPANASVPVRLSPEVDPYFQHVSFPTHLRGCIFSNAPRLPKQYAEIVRYWSGVPMNAGDSRAVFFQNPQNEYMVSLSMPDADGVTVAHDELLSEGVVVCVQNLASLISGRSSDDFIEIKIPALESMLGIESDDFRTLKAYAVEPGQQYERIFLKISDILRSPDPDCVYVSLLRSEFTDYGFCY